MRFHADTTLSRRRLGALGTGRDRLECQFTFMDCSIYFADFSRDVKKLSFTNVAAAFAAIGVPNSGTSFKDDKDEMNSVPNYPKNPADKRLIAFLYAVARND